MSLLTESLPRTTPHGWPIAVDFRLWIAFECSLDRPQDPEAFIQATLARLYPSCTQAQRSAYQTQLWSDLLWFYRCGRPSGRAGSRRGGLPGRARAYDFGQDAPLILAAFRQAYSIDLTSARLHWWQFRALFEGLPADCRICKIMEYRTADTADMPEKTQVFYEKMKDRYRLPDLLQTRPPLTVEEHDAEFIRRLQRN